MDCHRLNDVMFLNRFFSASVSIKSPIKTNVPPKIADNTSQKIDSVVILLYAFLMIVIVGKLICFVAFIVGRRKGVY